MNISDINGAICIDIWEATHSLFECGVCVSKSGARGRRAWPSLGLSGCLAAVKREDKAQRESNTAGMQLKDMF